MIVTFYSYKGGTGRTMALANIAVVLARAGHRVLAVDFDLEAPGLVRFYEELAPGATAHDGLIDLLLAESAAPGGTDWRDYVVTVDGTLSLMTSGRSDPEYAAKVLGFDWGEFFAASDGAEFFERLRADWTDEYDFVLVDSRTGITDTGGICTITLPDVVVPVFTANHQSVDGVVEVVGRAQAGRQALDYDRPPLVVLPLPSRFDGRTELKSAQVWMGRFAEAFKPFYADWLPKGVRPRQILERTKLPYVAYFSFGERLPVLSEDTSDPESLGYALRTVATLIEGHLANAAEVLGVRPATEPVRERVEEPSLAVHRRPGPLARIPRTAIPTAVAALLGVVSLLVTNTLLVPFASITLLRGVGTGVEFFADEQVRRTLMSHRLEVRVVDVGSSRLAASDVTSYDFVLSSGEPGTDAVREALRQAGRETRSTPMFAGPLVLATTRPYAEALVRRGTAEEIGEPYYRVDLAKFLALAQEGRRWADLDVLEGPGSSAPITVHAPDVCSSNLGSAYLGLLATAGNGGLAPTRAEAREVARSVTPLLEPAESGSHLTDLRLPNAQHPVMVVEERDYLGHQSRIRASTGDVDRDLVLLYPTPGLLREVEVLPLTAETGRLTWVLADPVLHRRAAELGYRAPFRKDGELRNVLEQRGIPVVPELSALPDEVPLPEPEAMRTLTQAVGDCEGRGGR